MEDLKEDETSLRDLLATFGRDLRDLIRMEAELAAKEFSSKGEHAKKGLVSLGAGGALAAAGLVVVLGAVSVGLGFLLSLILPIYIWAWLAPLLVGGCALAIGGAAAKKGADSLKPSSFVPRQTLQSLKEDAEWVGRGLR
jgi:Putative Actinobacterial Holin-X, holin superfamily III